MMITTLTTSKVIDRTFSTGDLPILVTCNDQKQYICKYMRADSVSAYKLTSELIGSILAKYWNLNTPEIVFVKILPEHTKPFAIQYNHSAEAIGYQKINNAIDIANYINDDIKQSKILRQKINELFERQWIDDCFSNYEKTLRQNF